MWPKEEAPFIQSLLEFSKTVAGTSYRDVVSDSESGFTSGWDNVRPRAIYRPNRCAARRKLKVASSPVTRRALNGQSPRAAHVMRGTLDDSWNYHYPTSNNGTNKTVTARDKLEEIAEDNVKERNSNNQWEQEVHVQRLREAISALVKKDCTSLHKSRTTDQVEMLSQSSDKPAHRWAVEKPKIPHLGAEFVTQLTDKNTHRVTTIPHHVRDMSHSSQLLSVQQLPIATYKGEQAVKRHKVLDPTIRYELSQLVQSQLYSQLLVEQQSVNDQLLKVSSALLLPSSSSSSSAAAQHSELQGSHSYPNISTNARACSFNNNRTALHKFSLPRRF